MVANGNGEVKYANGGGGTAGEDPDTEEAERDMPRWQHDAGEGPDHRRASLAPEEEVHTTTPIKGFQGGFANLSEEERQKQQLQSIRYEYFKRKNINNFYTSFERHYFFISVFPTPNRQKNPAPPQIL